MAGAMPVASAASRVVAIQMTTTGTSNVKSSTRGNDGGAAIRSDRISSTASSRPMALPATAMSELSVNSCRTSRARVPPIAARIASSRCRATLRDRSRLATLAHAISRTSAAAAATIDSAGRAVTVMSSPSGRACTAGAPPVPKKNSVELCRGAARAAAVPSASACATVTPGLSRPSAVNTIGPASAAGDSGIAYGTQKRTPGSGNANAEGMTPTMVCAMPSMTIAAPSAPAGDPDRSRASASLTITTGAADWRSSSGVKKRPLAGATPSVLSTVEETRAPAIFTCSPPRVT